MSNTAPLVPRSQAMTVLLLALLLGLQPITTDLYLPALPAMAQGFNASMVQAQLTLTSLLLAFGTSQLVWGPLSDKWGRRPVLLGGIAVYLASAIGCVLAPSIEALIAARTLQGVAMGACVMAARAIVRDRIGGHCLHLRSRRWFPDRFAGMALGPQQLAFVCRHHRRTDLHLF